jgi:hypothetical protein
MSEYYILGSWKNNGSPNYLDTDDEIDTNIINRVIRELPKKVSVSEHNPTLLENTASRNIIIQSANSNFNGADIHVTFIHEGAGYKNSFGYFSYPLNGGYTIPTKYVNGNYIPLTYNDKDSIDVHGKSTLKKTIVFPHCKLPSEYKKHKNDEEKRGDMRSGNKVKLLYDPSNPLLKFPNNTGVCFFIIPNGWDEDNARVKNENDRIYTYDAFNTNSVQQTLLFYDHINSDSSSDIAILTFEDIMRPDGDGDFNDLAIKISITHGCMDFSNHEQLPSLEPITTDECVADNTGFYLKLKDETINTIKSKSGNGFKVKHKIKARNVADCNRIKSIYGAIDYKYPCVVEDDTSTSFCLIYTIPKSELTNYNYFFETGPNIYKGHMLAL